MNAAPAMPAPSGGRLAHRLALAACLAYALLGMATLPAFGPQWDCWEHYTGDRALYFWLTLDADYLAPAKPMPMPLYQRPGHPDFQAITHAALRNPALAAPHHIWPVGPLSASLAKWLTFGRVGVRDPFDAAHLALPLWGALLLYLVWRLAASGGHWLAGAVAMTGLACHPRLWAHLHNNLKDLPSAVVFTLVLVLFQRAVTQRRAGWLALAGAATGLALATKANALFLPVIMGPYLALHAWQQWRPADQRPSRAWAYTLLACPLLALLVFCLAWPYMLLDFPQHLRDYWQYLNERGMSGSPHWKLTPLRQAIYTMPPALLLGLVLGLVTIAWSTWRARRLAPLHLLLLLWLAVPLLRVSMPRADAFDGIRHYLEFVPAAALLAGLGVSATWRALLTWPGLTQRWPAAARALARPGLILALWLACLSPTVVWLGRWHPYPLCYYNALAGGLPGARAMALPDATDYWASSYRQASHWLNAQAPPGTLVLVGVADHLFAYTRTLWLRPDLRVRSAQAETPEALAASIRAWPGAVWLLYLVRPEQYPEFVRVLDAARPPFHELKVEGEPIVRLLELRPAPQNGPTPAP